MERIKNLIVNNAIVLIVFALVVVNMVIDIYTETTGVDLTSLTYVVNIALSIIALYLILSPFYKKKEY